MPSDDYILVNGSLYHSDELYHHGVKGMKWGVRKKNISVREAGQHARKAYKKAYEDSATKSGAKTASIPGGTVSVFPNRKSKTAARSAGRKAAIESATNDAQANRDRRQAINKIATKLESKSTFNEKLLYNYATREKAAKYVVDKNMSMNEAYKKAKREALRNTAAFVGVYGAITVASIMAAK